MALILFMVFSLIVYIVWVFIKIYQLHKKNKKVSDVLVKINLIIIGGFAFLYYYLMPIKGFLFWGTVTPVSDYGEAIANASLSIINYTAVF